MPLTLALHSARIERIYHKYSVSLPNLGIQKRYEFTFGRAPKRNPAEGPPSLFFGNEILGAARTMGVRSSRLPRQNRSTPNRGGAKKTNQLGAEALAVALVAATWTVYAHSNETRFT